MKTSCKNCKCSVHADFPAEDNCVKFDDFGRPLPGRNDNWICFVCTDEVCLNCYMKHVETAHPEVYSFNCLTCGSMTLYKDFVDYHWCVKCKPAADGNHSCKDCKPWEHQA